jgi:uncharacterized protein YdhG (YjbR/CyaY superfamily)
MSTDIQQKIDHYLSKQPKAARLKLEEIRSIISSAVPEAEPAWSYGVPAFKVGKKTIMYAAFKAHVGLYPTPQVIIHFKKELKGYSTDKGTIRFGFDEELPDELIARIAIYLLRSHG